MLGRWLGLGLWIPGAGIHSDLSGHQVTTGWAAWPGSWTLSQDNAPRAHAMGGGPVLITRHSRSSLHLLAVGLTVLVPADLTVQPPSRPLLGPQKTGIWGRRCVGDTA